MPVSRRNDGDGEVVGFGVSGGGGGDGKEPQC